MNDVVSTTSPAGLTDTATRGVHPKYHVWSRGMLPGNNARKFDAATRLTSDSYIDLGHKPKFKLSADDKFFTIGSCFARNIEVALSSQGFEVLSLDIALPAAAMANHKHAAGTLTKFNTFSMLNEIKAALEGATIRDDGLIELGPNSYWDSQLHHVPLLDLETAKTVREAVYTTFRKIAETDVCIITLGLTEMWWDKENGAALNDAPIDWRHAKRTNRFEFQNPGFEDIKRNVFELCEAIYQGSNQRAKIVLTVSPVPLQRTLTGHDVIVANTYSKSALRAAADAAVRELEYVDYYPSFEFVQNTPRALAWEHDQRHVKDDLVRYVTRRFLDIYVDR